MMARFRYFYSLLKVKIRVKKGQKGATRCKQEQRFIKLKNILVLGALLSSHKPLRAYGQDVCCKDSMQAGVYEADIGSFLCCSGNSLQEQCTRCDTEK